MVLNTPALELIKSTTKTTLTGYSYVGFGTDSTIPVSSDTTLSSEVGRILIDSIDINTDDITNNIRIPLSEMNGETLTKLGVFDASSSGNLASAKEFGINVTKTSDDEILITYKNAIEVTNI